MSPKAKNIIKAIAIIVFVPSVLVGGYYGVRYGVNKYNAWKSSKKNQDSKQ